MKARADTPDGVVGGLREPGGQQVVGSTPGIPAETEQEAITVVLVEQVAKDLARRAAERDSASAASEAVTPADERLAELGQLVRDSSTGCVTTTLEGVIEDVNPAACRMFGYTEVELVGTAGQALAHPEHAAEVERALAELVAGRRTFYEAARVYRHRDGHKVPVRCTVRRIAASDGRPARVVALMEDLSSRVSAVASRLAAEQTHRAVLDTATDAFVSIDSAGRVLEWNAAAVALFGYTAAEATGRALWTLIVPTSLAERHQRAVARASAGGAPSIIGKAVELPARHKDGSTLTIELTVWSTPSASGGTRFHAFCRDMGERIAAGRAMAEVNQQLEAAFEASPTADAVIDAAGTLVEVNPVLCRFLHTRPEAAVGRAWLSLFPEADAAHAEALLARLRSTGHVTGRTEIRCSTADGQVVWGLISLMAMPGAARPGRVMLRIENIQDVKDLEVALVRQASHDAITGLPNRALFLERARQAMQSRRGPGPVAIVTLRLQGLRGIIDRDGYAVGDEVLATVAERLSLDLPADVTLAHLHPGQFAVVVPSGPDEATRMSERFLEALRAPFLRDGTEVSLHASIGISAATPGPEGAAQIGQVVQDAENAAREARKAGSDRIAFAAPEMRAAQQHRDRMEATLRDVLAEDTVAVAYQPVFDLTTGDLVGAEALLRVQDADGTPLPPLDVVAVAETSGQIIEIGRRVLRLAARQSAAWLADHDVLLPVAVNVSAVQLGRPAFVRDVLEAVEEAGVSTQALTLELTESVLLKAGSDGIDQLTVLRDAGVQLAIDDFGTGYASLSYLRDLPATTLKIDRSFVEGIPHDVGAVAIVAGVIGLAKNFGMSCIAEGIETEAQRSYLSERGVLGQGYLLGRPEPAAAISGLLAGTTESSPPVATHLRSFAEARDEAGDRRDLVADQRDQVGDTRDRGGDRRDRAGNQRDDVADQRDLAGDRRDLAADRRDVVADDRDQAGTTRDRAAALRDSQAEQDGAQAPAGTAGAPDLTAAVRREAAADRLRASQDREAGASERAQAGLDRNTALGDRGAGALERVQAELDRNIALADRGSGAGERVRAEGDRAIASSDRSAAAEDRAALSIDDVTGTYLRGPGLVELDRDLARAGRTGASLVLAFVDVDRLKAVNTLHGHEAGDRVLRDVADALRSSLRPYDLIVRVGGDQFVCAIAGLDLAEAEARFALVHAALGRRPLHPVVTIGISQMVAGESAQQLLGRADAGLREQRSLRRPAAGRGGQPFERATPGR